VWYQNDNVNEGFLVHAESRETAQIQTRYKLDMTLIRLQGGGDEIWHCEMTTALIVSSEDSS
jgi:hypothetical protein